MAGRPGAQWEPDGTHCTTHRNTLAVFSIPDAGFSSSNVGCTPLGGGGVWSGEMLSPDSPSAALAVCSTSLVSVSKLDKGTGSKQGARATPDDCQQTKPCRNILPHKRRNSFSCWMSPPAPCSRDLSSNRLACGTGGGEIIIFDLGSRRLEEVSEKPRTFKNRGAAIELTFESACSYGISSRYCWQGRQSPSVGV